MKRQVKKNKRNKLFLIGNGFDLAHGMKTRYEDFILDRLKSKVLGTFGGYKVDSSCDDQLISISNKSSNLNCRSKISNADSLAKFHEAIESDFYLVGKNHFIKRLLSKTVVCNWIDIEYEFYKELKSIFNICKEEDVDKERRSKIQDDELKNLNLSFGSLKTELEDYLTSVKPKFGPIPDISNAIQYELEGFSDDEHALFLNFNYTSTLQLYIPNLKLKNVDVNHIHGELNSKDNPIIFGYGDEMDPYYEKMENLNDYEFLKNMKSFSYSKTKNYQNLFRFLNSDQYDVVIMGHSCGLSDRVLLNSVFENENCKSIKIYYYQKSKEANDYFEKVLDISRHFKPESKNEMRLKIVPFVGCKPLVAFSGN